MFRTLEEVANATPTDYLSYAPSEPLSVAMKMISLARQKFPIINADDGVERFQNYDFLYVGPGSGLVCQGLLQQGHTCFGLETSRRGIRYGAPDEVRNYVLWAKPWESPFATKVAINSSGAQRSRPAFHVTVINKYLKDILTPEEWGETLTEMKRISRYVILFNSK